MDLNETSALVTGGASAAYGADALSGVVNFILRSDYEGFDIGAQYGVTQEGDGEELSVNGLFGADFSDGRGNVLGNLVDAQQELVEAATRAESLARARFEAGFDSYLSQLDAQRTLYGAQQALVATRLAEQANRVTLYRVLGGGWREDSAVAGVVALD